MIERYSRKEMAEIWEEKNKYQIWLSIEIAAAQAMEKLKIIPKGTSAKIRKNRRVSENSIRIVYTNISKSNTFYGPITQSAMRTLLKPKCTPLKLPENKFNLWKNLTITFDYSIMKGFSG